MRTRCLGGTLLVIKGLNDCVTIERLSNGRFGITKVEGDWSKEELKEALKEWYGSDAQKR